jgi:hypothetical protein
MDMMTPLASFLVKQGEQTKDDCTSKQVTTDCFQILPGMEKLETCKAIWNFELQSCGIHDEYDLSILAIARLSIIPGIFSPVTHTWQ